MEILLNKQLDKEVYLGFRESVVGGVNFGEKIKKEHPLITEENHRRYIDDFYQEHQDELEITRRETGKCFDDIKDLFFAELKKYFGHDFSKNNYVCCLSIFDCNPRFLENKTFQIFYKKSCILRKEVIAHELTHFAFFDFCNGLRIKYDNTLWELSEIFNVIFLNLQPMRNIIGADELLFYPDLKEKLEKTKKIWEEQPNVKNFIGVSLRYLLEMNRD